MQQWNRMAKNVYALEIEYRDTQEEMRGISPKLSLHADLQKRLDEIKKILGHDVPAKKTSGQTRDGSKKHAKRYFSKFHKQ